MAAGCSFAKEAKSMKRLIIAVAALSCLTASAQLGVDAIAKQRARDVANQNNNRGTEPPNYSQPGQARSAAPSAPVAPQLNAAQQAFANFQKQLFGVTTNATADQKGALAADMGNVAQGTKPSPATLGKLSDHLTTALGESGKLTPQRKTHAAQEIGMLLNSANTPQTQKDAMVKDVQSILEGGGASSENASAVAADLTTVTDEIKPK
jgi:hypothetical protein